MIEGQHSPSFGTLTVDIVQKENYVTTGGGTVTVCDADTIHKAANSRVLNYVNASFPSGVYTYKVYMTHYTASAASTTATTPVHFNSDLSLPKNNTGENKSYAELGEYKRIVARGPYTGSSLNGTITEDLSDCSMVLAAEQDVNASKHPRIGHIKVTYDVPTTKAWKSY